MDDNLVSIIKTLRTLRNQKLIIQLTRQISVGDTMWIGINEPPFAKQITITNVVFDAETQRQMYEYNEPSSSKTIFKQTKYETRRIDAGKLFENEKDCQTGSLLDTAIDRLVDLQELIDETDKNHLKNIVERELPKPNVLSPEVMQDIRDRIEEKTRDIPKPGIKPNPNTELRYRVNHLESQLASIEEKITKLEHANDQIGNWTINGGPTFG